MNAEEMKKCPFCAETIRAEAVKCRYCGSMLSKGGGAGAGSPQGYWHRVAEGKKIAGVCTGIAMQLDAPVLIMPLRVFFVISTLFYFFGPIVYVLLWLLMPAPVGEQQTVNQQQYAAPTAGPATGPVAPPVVDSYPGQAAPPRQAPPMASQPGAGTTGEGNGTIGLGGEAGNRQVGADS